MKKFLIIFYSISFGVAFILAMIFLSYLIPQLIIQEDINKLNIQDYLLKYKSNQAIYSEDKKLCIDNNIYSFNFQICWINDNTIIYKKNKDYFILENDSIININEKYNLNIDATSLIYSNKNLYYKYMKSYFKLDCSSYENTEILESDYYMKRDGEKYSFSKNDDLFIIENNINNKQINLTKKEVLSILPDNFMYNYLNYKFIDDMLMLLFKCDNCYITISYNMLSNEINIHDWSMCQYSDDIMSNSYTTMYFKYNRDFINMFIKDYGLI